MISGSQRQPQQSSNEINRCVTSYILVSGAI